MKNNIISGIFLIAFVLQGAISLAGEAVIEAKDLFKIMNSKDVVIVSAQSPEEYQKVHIKNAVHVYHKDLYNKSGVKSMLLPESELAGILGNKGISNTQTIVVYDQGTGKYAGRLYWILKYMGCQDVKILNGQLKAWMAARKPITKNPTASKKVEFKATPSKALLATLTDVKSGSNVIVDVRSAAEYNGTEGDTDKKGHIPGAVNIEYKNVLNEDGSFKTADEIKAAFSKAGVGTDKNIILYCTSSVRAGIVFAALTEIVGLSNVKVYDGAFYEWEAKGNPIEK